MWVNQTTFGMSLLYAQRLQPLNIEHRITPFAQTTVVLKNFAVGYFHVKFVRGKIFSSLGVSNELKTLPFIHC